jgi:hypothetical protein
VCLAASAVCFVAWQAAQVLFHAAVKLSTLPSWHDTQVTVGETVGLECSTFMSSEWQPEQPVSTAACAAVA